MKKILSMALVVLLVVFAAGTTNAQSKMSVSVGPDVLMPMGTFGDAYSIGFGGSARGQYDVMPNLGVGLTVGYFTWSAKDAPAGVDKPTFSGLPVRVFGKYYFMPGQLRVYGIAELGLFFWSSKVSTPVVHTPFGDFGGTFESTGSDFSYAPGVGVEIPAGKLLVDLSLRYDGIATSGSSTGNLGVRAGLNFAF
jgi:hypothetical protein